MTEQQIIEPEARLLVELGQERGVLYEDELAALAVRRSTWIRTTSRRSAMS